MFEVRIHGRGGQGVVSAAEMLSVAAFQEGRHAQAFPSFGSGRIGASVVAFCRIDDKEIRLREPVMEPDALVVEDSTLLQQVDLFNGLRPSGYIVVDSTCTFEELGIGEYTRGFRGDRLFTVPATEIAMKHLGIPVPNVPLLGGLAAVSGCVRLDSIIAAIRAKFPSKVAEANVAAAAEGYAAATKLRVVSHA
jgi:pyruvate ferredoxin oxidoreductase gamma subunit